MSVVQVAKVGTGVDSARIFVLEQEDVVSVRHKIAIGVSCLNDHFDNFIDVDVTSDIKVGEYGTIDSAEDSWVVDVDANGSANLARDRALGRTGVRHDNVEGYKFVDTAIDA